MLDHFSSESPVSQAKCEEFASAMSRATRDIHTALVEAQLHGDIKKLESVIYGINGNISSHLAAFTISAKS